MSSRPRDHVDGGEGPPDCRTTGIGFYEREPSLFAATAACPSSDRVMSVSDRGDTKTAGVQGPEHRIDRYTAIERYTAGTARLCFEGHRRGTLEPGRLADLVAYPTDPLTADTDALPSLAPAFTIVGGRPVHDPDGRLAA